MKTLQEFKDEYAIEQGYESWTYLLYDFDAINHDEINSHLCNLSELIQKEQQKLIAENAKIDNLTSESKYDVIVDKKSILNENNIIR